MQKSGTNLRSQIYSGRRIICQIYQMIFGTVLDNKGNPVYYEMWPENTEDLKGSIYYRQVKNRPNPLVKNWARSWKRRESGGAAKHNDNRSYIGII